MFARARRWGDNDKNFGPFTYARDRRYKHFAIVLSSRDDEDPYCKIRFSCFGHTFISILPQIIRPWREKVHVKDWDEATVARLGRDWYWNIDAREYGVSYSEGFLQIKYGRQSNDSTTDKTKGYFLPWTQWRHVRHNLYDLDGNFYADVTDRNWNERERYDAIEEACPKATFAFTDFDGEALTATTKIEEREWRFGTGWFKWLSAFRKPRISRDLFIEFSGETGRRKGSWKGGTIGHSIEMQPGELHESAFRRYCDEHDMTFTGVASCV